MKNCKLLKNINRPHGIYFFNMNRILKDPEKRREYEYVCAGGGNRKRTYLS